MEAQPLAHKGEKSSQRGFLDIHHHETLAWINDEMRSTLALLGFGPLTLSDITGNDRTITRAIASWLQAQRDSRGVHLIGGVRFESKHGGGLECWAAFPAAEMRVVDSHFIEKEDTELQAVASMFGLTIH